MLVCSLFQKQHVCQFITAPRKGMVVLENAGHHAYAGDSKGFNAFLTQVASEKV